MTILAMCPDSSCGELFEVPDTAVGTRVKCPACGAIQTIVSGPIRPAAEEPPGKREPVAAAPEEPLEFAEPEEPEPTQAETDAKAETDWADALLQKAPPSEEDDAPFLVPDEEPPAPSRKPAPAAPTPTARPAPRGQPAAGETPMGGEEEAFMPVKTRREVRSLYGPESMAERQVNASQPSQSFLSSKDVVPPLSEGQPEDLFAAEPQDEHVEQENKLVVSSTVFVGLLGLAAGLLAGWGLVTSMPVLGAGLGAGIGWVLGVVIAFMLILANPRDENAKTRCVTCGNVFPAGTETCKWCGADLPPADVNPLTAGCLQSHSYAVSNMKGAVALAAVLGVVAGVMNAAFRLDEVAPNAPRELHSVLIGLSVVLAFLVGSCWLRYFLTVVGGTLVNYDQAPDPPMLWDLRNVLAGIKGLGVVAMYVVPMFPLPVLPMALLRLSTPSQDGVFDPTRNARSALAHARDFAALWLWLLLWLAVMAFVGALIVLLFRLTELIPEMEPQSQFIVGRLLDGAEIIAMAATAAVCGTAMFRCIGLFARQNAPTLLSQDEYRAPTPRKEEADADSLF